MSACKRPPALFFTIAKVKNGCLPVRGLLIDRVITLLESFGADSRDDSPTGDRSMHLNVWKKLRAILSPVEFKRLRLIRCMTRTWKVGRIGRTMDSYAGPDNRGYGD